MLINCLKQGIKNRNSVLNRVGKSAIFVLNRIRIWGAAPHLPTQGYIEYPPGISPAFNSNSDEGMTITYEFPGVTPGFSYCCNLYYLHDIASLQLKLWWGGVYHIWIPRSTPPPGFPIVATSTTYMISPAFNSNSGGGLTITYEFPGLCSMSAKTNEDIYLKKRRWLYWDALNSWKSSINSLVISVLKYLFVCLFRFNVIKIKPW